MATIMSVAGSAVALAPATTLSSSAGLGSGVQQLGAVRSPAASFHGSRMVAVRASQSSNEERSPKALVALVAAGAALALTVAPMSPAHAGLFGTDSVKVELGATSSDFPGNEGTGTNTDVAKNAKDAASDAKNKLFGGLADAGSVANNAKDGAKSRGLPDSTASNAQNLGADANSKLFGSERQGDFSDAAKGMSKVGSQSQGEVVDAAKDISNKVESAKGSNPLDAGKSFIDKITGN